MQALFSKLLIVGAFLLLAADSRDELPDRQPLPERQVALHYDPIALGAAEGVTITGAWMLRADDQRVFGLSALTVLPEGRLQAVSDSGVLVTFAKPEAGRSALVGDLPSGPGYPTFKKYRDSEAVVIDPVTGTRLVAFENQHSIWRYPADGPATALPLRLPTADWKANKGVEAMVEEPGGALLLIPEAGQQVLRVTQSPTPADHPLSGATGGIADAVRLPDGRIVVAVREIGLFGLINRLAWLERSGAGYRLRNFATLPLGAFDNVEGLAVEPQADGRTILWAVTDNDGWRRTLLIRMELNARKAPTGAGA